MPLAPRRRDWVAAGLAALVVAAMMLLSAFYSRTKDVRAALATFEAAAKATPGYSPAVTSQAKLLEAAEILARQPQAMQLRYRSTLNVIAGEKNSTVIFPFPMELANLLPPKAAHSSE